MTNTYVSFIGAGIVILAISAICHLFLLVIHDNYIFPPSRWTVKAFLLMLFILSMPSICIEWVVSKVSRKHHVEGDVEKSLECSVEKRKMKILVIDDWRIIAESVRQTFPDAQVDHMYRLPWEDLSELDNYDILFVDNEGIGNKQYRSGQEFLREYTPKSDKQMVIYYSGLSPHREFKEVLDTKGFFSFTKGGRLEELTQLVTENFKGGTDEQRS